MATDTAVRDFKKSVALAAWKKRRSFDSEQHAPAAVTPSARRCHGGRADQERDHDGDYRKPFRLFHLSEYGVVRDSGSDCER